MAVRFGDTSESYRLTNEIARRLERGDHPSRIAHDLDVSSAAVKDVQKAVRGHANNVNKSALIMLVVLTAAIIALAYYGQI